MSVYLDTLGLNLARFRTVFLGVNILTDDEIVDVRQALIGLIRSSGWESLFEPISTPSDLVVNGAGSRAELRRLVEGLIALINVLPQLEDSIAQGEPDIKLITFEIDPAGRADDRALVLPKIDRESANRSSDRYGNLRQTLQALRVEIETYN